MLKESWFFNIFLKIFCFFASSLKNSFLWTMLSGLNDKFNKSADKSVIVSAVSSESAIDDKYAMRYGKIFKSVSDCIKKWFGWVSKSAQKSSIVGFACDFCSNFVNIPLKYIGFFFVSWGIVALVGSFLMGAKVTAFLICGCIAFAGGVLLLFKKGIICMLNESFLFSWIVRHRDNNFEVKEYNVKWFILWGVVSGIASALLGIIPVALVFVAFVASVVGFNFTSFVAVVYVCALPFLPTMAMVAGGLALFFCVFIKSVLGYNDKLFSDSKSANMYLLFMGIAFSLATAFSADAASSLKIVLVYVAFLFAAYALIRILSYGNLLINVLNGISLCSIPVSLFGIYQHFSGFDAQNTWIDTSMFEDISGRVVSFFGNPNVFGEYLILTIVTSIICIFIADNRKFKIIHFCAVALSGLSLIYTYSRGCWIGVIFALAVFLFISKRKLFFAFCVLGAVSIFFLPSSIINRIASVGNVADSSTLYRVYIWKGTLDMLKDYWITGVGLGTDAFNCVYPLYSYTAITAPHSHNLYLVIFSETGIVGMIAFALIVLLFYKKLFVIIKHSANKNLKYISTGLVAAMSGFLLQGMFDNVWYNYRIFLLFWIYIALGVIVDIVFGREKCEKSKSN